MESLYPSLDPSNTDNSIFKPDNVVYTYASMEKTIKNKSTAIGLHVSSSTATQELRNEKLPTASRETGIPDSSNVSKANTYRSIHTITKLLCRQNFQKK